MSDNEELTSLFRKILGKPEQIFSAIKRIDPENEEAIIRDEEKIRARMQTISASYKELTDLLDEQDYTGFRENFEDRDLEEEFLEKYARLRFLQAEKQLDIIEDKILEEEQKIQAHVKNTETVENDDLSSEEVKALSPLDNLSKSIEEKLNQTLKLFSQSMTVSEKFDVRRDTFREGKDEAEAVEDLQDKVRKLHQKYQQLKSRKYS